MSYEDSVGVCAEFELSYNNVKYIHTLYHNSFDYENKHIRIFDLYNGSKGKYFTDGLFCYHKLMFNMNNLNAIPCNIKTFKNKYTDYDYTVLEAVINNVSDDLLKTYFETRGDIEKNFILNFNCISINYDKKPEKLKLEIAKACVDMFKSYGVPEDNIICYKHDIL